MESGDGDSVTDDERERIGRWQEFEETGSVQLIVDGEPTVKAQETGYGETFVGS